MGMVVIGCIGLRKGSISSLCYVVGEAIIRIIWGWAVWVWEIGRKGEQEEDKDKEMGRDSMRLFLKARNINCLFRKLIKLEIGIKLVINL